MTMNTLVTGVCSRFGSSLLCFRYRKGCADRIPPKKPTYLENTPRRSPTSRISGRMYYYLCKSQLLWEMICSFVLKKNYFWSGDLDLWPMTLTFKLDLDNHPLDLHTKIQVCPFICESETHTEKQTDRAKTITPVASLTRGVITSVVT